MCLGHSELTTNPIVLIFQILGNADYVFTSIFTLEIILKVTNLSNALLSFSLFLVPLEIPQCYFHRQDILDSSVVTVSVFKNRSTSV